MSFPETPEAARFLVKCHTQDGQIHVPYRAMFMSGLCCSGPTNVPMASLAEAFGTSCITHQSTFGAAVHVGATEHNCDSWTFLEQLKSPHLKGEVICCEDGLHEEVNQPKRFISIHSCQLVAVLHSSDSFLFEQLESWQLVKLSRL